MAARFWRKGAPLLLEWSALGSFVMMGDVAAQWLESVERSRKVRSPTRATTASPPSGNTSQPAIKQGDETGFHLDHSRLLGAACTGLLWVAPITMVWFPFLHRFMAKKFSHLSEGSFKYVLTKVTFENVCLAVPVCVGYFAIPAAVEGDSLSALIDRLNSDFLPTIATDVSFWLMVSPFNYKFVSVRYQAGVSCILGGIEAAGLSAISHREVCENECVLTTCKE